MAIQQFARATLFVNGVEQEHVTGIDLQFQGGWVPVKTIKHGLSGFTPSGGHTTLKVSVAIPLGGPEVDFQAWCVDGSIVTVQVPIGAKDYIGNGQILNCDFSQSTDKELVASFEWTGELSKFQ